MARGQVEKNSQNLILHAPPQSPTQYLQEAPLQPDSDVDPSQYNSSVNNNSMWSKFITEDQTQSSSSDSENYIASNNSSSSKVLSY
ncbi:hypothetical protein AYI70_g8615 [Smittium culicis]|uniref:Uncharacterized protein n=1 Tax=Smittium culicis TaxID=133412 RepID=A0A1R1X4E0_9FUNG|nr:hypothetical protein AYI70_g10897 [Smittium culicis]OMJ11612.1 hypothetical protein AYI70_g9610 [Smittium culicis]OMJ13269.1 hypothetical protein AYI70_g8615 [Smittium culicis]